MEEKGGNSKSKRKKASEEIEEPIQESSSVDFDANVEEPARQQVLGSFKNDKVKLTLTNETSLTDKELIFIPCSQEGYVLNTPFSTSITKHLDFGISEKFFSDMGLANLQKLGHASVDINEKVTLIFISLPRSNAASDLEDYFVSALERQFSKKKMTSILIPLIWADEIEMPVLDGSIIDTILHSIHKIASSVDHRLNFTLTPLSALSDVERQNIRVILSELGYEADQSIKDKIDFHLDDPALEDKLGRKPIAQSLAQLINNDIFNNDKCYAFMTHLQGRWGEGKSSFMKFLEDGLQETGDGRWIVIHYNAWKNQSVDPPWWTFLDAIYRQGKERIKGWTKLWIRIKEWSRRMNSSVLLGISIFFFLLLLLIAGRDFWSSALRFLFNLDIGNLDIGNLDNDTEKIITVSTLVASLWAVGQAWGKFLVINTPENAQLFMRRAQNPSVHIKKHFNTLIRDLQRAKTPENKERQIAIFIDDLDRCDGDFVVSLLEGIQTMFNEQKVFYLVAADKHWIAKSFENVYREYTDTVKDGTQLGYSFIEKNFQLSLRLPNPSENQIERYWSFILNQKKKDEEQKDSDHDGFRSELRKSGQEKVLSGEAELQKLATDYNMSIEDAQTIMLETVNETTEDLKHLLLDHHKLIGTNPRAVKRLANQYTVYRNLILIEQDKVEPLKIFRWVILQNRWPLLTNSLERIPSLINNYQELVNNLKLSAHESEIRDVIGSGKDKITEQDVKTFTGIHRLVLNESTPPSN